MAKILITCKKQFFLGVIVDENLNWKCEISHVADKVSKSIGIIRKSALCLSASSQTLCISLVYPYFFYWNLVWASTYKTNLALLVILQKRAVRTTAKTPFYAQIQSLKSLVF